VTEPPMAQLKDDEIKMMIMKNWQTQNRQICWQRSHWQFHIMTWKR